MHAAAGKGGSANGVCMCVCVCCISIVLFLSPHDAYIIYLHWHIFIHKNSYVTVDVNSFYVYQIIHKLLLDGIEEKNLLLIV